MSSISFSPEQQQALLGHIVTDPKIYDAYRTYDLKSGHFDNPNGQRVASRLVEFVDEHHRHPTDAELRAALAHGEGYDSNVTKASVKYLDQALSMRTEIAFGTLLDDLRHLKLGTLFLEGMVQAEQVWNKQMQDEAWKTIEDLVATKNQIDNQGVTASTYDSETWSIRERQDRVEMKGKIIKTGLSYLDDAMNGIAPDDLVLVASKTGVGKSQLCAQIALAATAAGKRVFLLALEAAPGEMQRRLKFPTIMRHYRAANPKGEDIDYVKYCHGEYTDLLAPHEDAAHVEYVSKYATLKTLYKHSASYTCEDMERDIMRRVQEVDLIIVDHLHYIDGNDKDSENVAAKKLIKKLREIGQSMRKPIIAAAHVRKTDGPRKFAPVLPGIEDVMGSSDLVKVATHVVLLGPTAGLDDSQLDLSAAPEIAGSPTFVRVVKSRTAGLERTQYTAVCFFQRDEGRYSRSYLLGRLGSADTKWSPVWADARPKWANYALRWNAPTNAA